MSAFLTSLNTATANDYKGTAMPHLFFPLFEHMLPIGLEAPNLSVYLALARGGGCQLSENSLILLMPHLCQYAAKE